MAQVCPACKGKKVEIFETWKGTGTFYPMPVLGAGAHKCGKCKGRGHLDACPVCGGRGNTEFVLVNPA